MWSRQCLHAAEIEIEVRKHKGGVHFKVPVTETVIRRMGRESLILLETRIFVQMILETKKDKNTGVGAPALRVECPPMTAHVHHVGS